MKKIRIVATGDSLITMKQSVHSEPAFLAMIDLIRDADVAFTNLEMLLHNFEGYPAEESGGSYARADPKMIEELKWMGFVLFSTANNHSLDYTYGGLISTIDNLNAAGVTHAGTGLNLAQARQPAYLETPSGRLAIISAASTFASFGRAGAARRDMHGRPGLNPIRYESIYEVSEPSVDALKQVAGELALSNRINKDGSYQFLRKKFIVGNNIGVHTKPHGGDLMGNVEAVRCAVRQADWVLFSIHSHEGREGDISRPAEFIEITARNVIDSGAHAVIGHGPHILRGIEIRDGKPIFYSLGNFISQNFTIYKLPADIYDKYNLNPYNGTPADVFDVREKNHHAFVGEYAQKRWEGVIPSMTFEGDRLIDLKLYPIELGWGNPRSQRGRPMLASLETAEDILHSLQKLSEPYGTEINVEEGVGILVE